jgi:hypothetical protein
MSIALMTLSESRNTADYTNRSMSLLEMRVLAMDSSSSLATATRPRHLLVAVDAALLAYRDRLAPAIDIQRKRVGHDQDADAPGKGGPDVIARGAGYQE